MTRIALPNRRPCIGWRFSHGGVTYQGTASFTLTPEGKVSWIGEIFLSGGKVGSEVEAVTRDAAVIVSLALQHGTPLETIRGSITRLDDGSAAGPIGCMLDEISKEINHDY